MKDSRVIIILFATICIGILVALFPKRPTARVDSEEQPIIAVEGDEVRGQNTLRRDPNLSGDYILENHGSSDFSGRDDVILMGRIVERVNILFRQTDTRHMATIADFSAFVTGKNPERLVYLDPNLPVFKDGVLTDRWGQPYMIHPLAVGEYEIRSAGPDGLPYTEDDWTMHPTKGLYPGASLDG